MTNRKIRGIAGQLFLVFLSILPMYFFAEPGTQEQSHPPQEQPVESHQQDTA